MESQTAPGTISVIIPVLNGERYLGESIESALGQTYQPIEILVVDNGSSDRSCAIASAFRPPVRVIDEPRRGLALARNRGIAVARGELLAFLDADDIWEPSKLACQVDLLQQPGIDLVFTNMRNFVSPELSTSDAQRLMVEQPPYAGLSASSLLARASVFPLAGLFPDVALGEFIAWFALTQSCGIKYAVVPETLVRRRVHLSNMTRLRSKDKLAYVNAVKLVLDSRRSGIRPQDA